MKFMMTQMIKLGKNKFNKISKIELIISGTAVLDKNLVNFAKENDIDNSF